jgi:hypothetical protein
VICALWAIVGRDLSSIVENVYYKMEMGDFFRSVTVFSCLLIFSDFVVIFLVSVVFCDTLQALVAPNFTVMISNFMHYYTTATRPLHYCNKTPTLRCLQGKGTSEEDETNKDASLHCASPMG